VRELGKGGAQSKTAGNTGGCIKLAGRRSAPARTRAGLALTRLETRSFLIDDVDLALAANDLVGLVARLQALERRGYLHFILTTALRPKGQKTR